ncbi:dUTP diphosphatase [Bacillus sp. NPDC077411]|uniref:dUTP diphosphatase n=1 Tax=Bacillus bruguierae TaxID=3127667 RepID=A0ABU8FDM8_9BACI|nr:MULTISPECIES: dUTP diphosphatase [Bacillus]SFJ27106.1 Dimeric dUTPase, all-alpha-NTP-PPase (MazG) superfamily [Bacillus sp. 71mf]SFS54777.1 Dimeric dUTPase, all-alpha-NTP-PPase (MazG) superfamily [Bacillus sp. 103mf]
MDLLQLFKLQKELDDRITKEHNLEPKKLLKEKMLALLVEIGELANETRCFKYWSNKPASERQVVLEEYVDGLHFILSIGIDLGIDKNFLFYKCALTNKTQVEIFLDVYAKAIRFNEQPSITNYIELFTSYLRLGQALDFGQEEIEKAYLDKNEVNHQRQTEGY